jgi:hypothetical protein
VRKRLRWMHARNDRVLGAARPGAGITQ